MSKYSETLLSAKLIQLNKNGSDLVKEQEHKFNRFVSSLAKKKPEQSFVKPPVFTPAYCQTCSKNNLKKSDRAARDAIGKQKLLENAFAEVEELYFSGGGGAGCAYPSAVNYASDFGLDLLKIKVSCGASVGAIMALGVALDVNADELQGLLAGMPTDSFQDWRFWNLFTKLLSTWGICRGQAMPSYFRQLIKERTGLDDPTFRELYDAGFKKELRVTTTNVSKGDIDVFSYKRTPDIKVAEIVALSCSIPVVFPVKRIMNEAGKFDIHTDGGIIKNYPWGMGASKPVSNEKRLGFALVNSFSLEQGKSITSFSEYVYYLFMLVMFQHPLSLTEEEKRRTFTINVDHNPIDFTPTPTKLKYLEDQSYIAVKKLAEQLCNNIVSSCNGSKKLRS